MPAADTFTCFNALPTELRLEIWRYALSVRSVWAAVFHEHAGPNLSAPYRMVHIGPAPHLAGMSCKEARQMLKRSSIRLIPGPFGTSHLVDLDTTVVKLGDYLDAKAFLDTFGTDQLAKLKYVTLPFYDRDSVFIQTIVIRLVKSCPALRVIIIHQTQLGLNPSESLVYKPPIRRPLSAETAAYYATIPERDGPNLASVSKYIRRGKTVAPYTPPPPYSPYQDFTTKSNNILEFATRYSSKPYPKIHWLPWQLDVDSFYLTRGYI